MEKELWDKMTKYTKLTELTKSEYHDKFEKVEDNIWVMSNFIDEETREKYLSFAQGVDEEEWWKHNRNWWVGKYLHIEEGNPLTDESSNLTDKIKRILNDDVYVGAFGSIHRLTPGQAMFIHTDNPAEKRILNGENGEYVGETEGYNNYCILAMVVYLNDFNGANLFFPNIGKEYHGKAGDLVIFPGTGVEYDHGVRVLEEGPNRYIITGFGYDQRVSRLKELNYVFEDDEGNPVEVDPYHVVNDPEEAMRQPPRPVS